MTNDDDDPPRTLAHPPRLPDQGRYDGPARAAPYALSRMAPSFSLVDVATEIDKADGERWFSLMAPDEWLRPQPQTFEGTYRLEADLSFTRVDLADDEPRADLEAVRALLAGSSR